MIINYVLVEWWDLFCSAHALTRIAIRRCVRGDGRGYDDQDGQAHFGVVLLSVLGWFERASIGRSSSGSVR